ncbi:MAG: hypothetical protein J0L92_32465 [Deltaproteobacteria bacterium]|nr:hypothetical protein [Deltaproteobacteria bacterium]
MLHSKTLLAALVLAPLVGCGAQLIPNTDVPDTVENREAVEFVEEYRHAVETHNPASILRLVSHDYFDDNGTPASGDDVDYETLQGRLGRWTGDVLDVRYEMRYRRVTVYPERVFVDVTYTGSFKVRTAEGERWERRLADNRLELIREDGELRIVSGL